VVNDALEPGAGFEVDTNRVTILDRDGGRWDIPLAGKDRGRRGNPQPGGRRALGPDRRKYLAMQRELGGNEVILSAPLGSPRSRPHDDTTPTVRSGRPPARTFRPAVLTVPTVRSVRSVRSVRPKTLER
jgi:hypothetical protein